MITATIVDDEPYSCESLATLLERYCPDVRVLDICYSASSALKSILSAVSWCALPAPSCKKVSFVIIVANNKEEDKTKKGGWHY